MEGIAGTYGFSDRALAKKMLDAIWHRGPDAFKVVAYDKAVLGARELAVTGAARPVGVYEDGRLAVASDSCIFNKAELLLEYFGTDEPGDLTDARLVMEMYRRDGYPSFGKIDGGYAVAVMDGSRLMLARDKYGLKPMYISRNRKRGCFSSEMKSQVLEAEPFIAFPPGKVFVPGTGFRTLKEQEKPGLKPTARSRAPKLIRDLVLESVGACTHGTSSVNVLLSGGLDSSVVAAAAAGIGLGLSTVCVGMAGGVDLEMARKVADHLGTAHRERIYEVDDMIDFLDEVIYAAETFDYPLVRSCIPNLIATRMIGGPPRLVLCGEGGDEVFGGYDYMRGIRSDRSLRAERAQLLRGSHSTGFQRVDRMTAYSELEGKMPLMHGRVIQVGLGLGRKDLIGPRQEQSKLALRRAFEGMLPTEVVWRRKQRFSDGAGSITALEKVAEELITDAEFERERGLLPKNRIRTKEELMYYRSFRKFYHSKSADMAVGFSPRP